MAYRPGCRAIALVAAYTLALNALLTPLAMAAPITAAAWADICNSTSYSQSPSGDKLPTGHQSCPAGACSLAGCSAAVASGDVGQVASLFLPGATNDISLPRRQDSAILPHVITPHLARAPPAA
jgi:hypothetical protein